MRKYILFFVTLFSTSFLLAEFKDDFQLCTLINNNQTRLACFDSLSTKHEQAKTQIKKPAALESSMANSVLATEKNEPEVKVVYIEKSVAKPDSIEARLLGDLKGWNKYSTFRLDNGQTWKAVKSNAKTKNFPKVLTNPEITITKGTFNSWNFRVKGIKGRLKVKRVK